MHPRWLRARPPCWQSGGGAVTRRVSRRAPWPLRALSLSSQKTSGSASNTPRCVMSSTRTVARTTIPISCSPSSPIAGTGDDSDPVSPSTQLRERHHQHVFGPFTCRPAPSASGVAQEVARSEKAFLLGGVKTMRCRRGREVQWRSTFPSRFQCCRLREFSARWRAFGPFHKSRAVRPAHRSFA